MGKIKKILAKELVGGTEDIEVYPVTSSKAVYDTSNRQLDKYLVHILNTYTFKGIANTSTDPGTPTFPVFYLATEGTYTNFSGIKIDKGQIGVLLWNNNSWSKEVLTLSNTSVVLLSNLDSLNSIVASAKGESFYKVYNVMYDDSANAGLLFVIGDTFNHVVTQLFLTHCILQDGTFSGNHDHTQVFLYERTYLNQWSEWKVTYLSKIQETLDKLNNYSQLLPFSGFVTGVSTETIGASTITSVVYDTVKGKFLGRNLLKYYDFWSATDSYKANTDYNDISTNKAKDVLFVDTTTGIVYKGPTLLSIQKVVNSYANSATSNNRPVNMSIGYQLFDTTLNMPIWYKGNNTWVNALGVEV